MHIFLYNVIIAQGFKRQLEKLLVTPEGTGFKVPIHFNGNWVSTFF